MGDIEPKVVTYAREVWRRLPKVEDPFDREVVDHTIIDFFEAGWTVGETASWVRLLEHVQPDLNEDYALGQMAVRTRRVRDRMEKEGIDWKKRYPWCNMDRDKW